MKQMKQRRGVFPTWQGEQGMALALTLLVMPLLSLLGLTFLTLSLTEFQIAQNEVNATRAFGVAEAGVSHGRRYLAEAAGTTGFNILLNGSSGNPVPIVVLQNFSAFGTGQGTYSVFVANNNTAYQGIPADVDPAVDTDNRLWLTAVGTYRDATRTVRALVEVNTLLVPPAALTVAGDEAEVEFEGNAFTVTGNDQPTPTQTGACGTPGAAKPGIALETPAALNELMDELNPNQADNITGAGGTPSVAVDSLNNNTMITNLANALIPYATIIWSEETTITGNTNIGSPMNPVIVVAYDEVELRGTGKGYGILIVRDELEIEGNFVWEGLIIVMGDDGGEFEAGGNAEVYGAVLVGSDEDGEGEAEIGEHGNPTVAYSSQALCRAAKVMPTTVLAWQEL